MKLQVKAVFKFDESKLHVASDLPSFVQKILADPRINARDFSDEREYGDGMWVYSQPGWCFGEEGWHTNHEWKVRVLWQVYKTLMPCSCEECVEQLEYRKSLQLKRNEPKTELDTPSS